MRDVSIRSTILRGGVFATLAALAMALLIVPPASACDDPVYVVAKQKWQPEPYTLMVAWQPGNFDAQTFNATLGQARGEWMDEVLVNLYPLMHDMSNPVKLAYDRKMFEQAGATGYPFVMLVDADGKATHRFPTLAEARERLTPEDPDNPRPFGAPAPVTLEAPPARVVVVYDNQLKRNDPENPEAAATPTIDVAKAWVADIAKTPLAEVSKADLVDFRSPGADKALIDSLQLKPLPVVVVADPDNVPVVTFDTLPTNEQLKALALSPVRDRILQTINPVLGPDGRPTGPDTAMIVLFCYGTDAQKSATSLAATRKAADLASNMFQVDVPVIEMDPTDPRERYLAQQIRHKAGQAEPTVVPIIGRGKAMDIFTAPTQAEPLLDLIHMAFRPCGCEVVPRDFGRDLLMGPGGGPWAPYDSKLAAAAAKVKPEQVKMDKATEELVAASFGVNPKTWIGIGGAALLALAVIGGLLLWAKSRTVPGSR